MKNKLKSILGITVVLVSLIGCTTTKVVSPEDSIVPLQSIAEEGDTMLLVNAQKENDLVTSLLGEDVGKRAMRMSLAVSPKNDDYPLVDFDFDAVLEGDFPYFVTNLGLKYGLSGEKENKEGLSYYKTDSMEVGILKTNMVGASNHSYVELAKKVNDKKENIDKLTILEMYDSNIAMYSKNPTTLFDLGLGLTQPMIKHMDSILLLIKDGEDNLKVLNASFDCDSTSSAKTLNMLIKSGYIAVLKKDGIRPDFSLLKIMFTLSGEIVNISSMPLTDMQYETLKKSISSNI